MPNKIFLCYHSKFRDQVAALSTELRLRGLTPWLDYERGFAVGDNTSSEARRVIGDAGETFGLLLYASPEAVGRTFIKKIELDAAIRRKQDDPDFVLTVLTDGLGFEDFRRQSKEHLGDDLTKYHGGSIREKDPEGIRTLPLRPQFQEFARMVLAKRLQVLLCHAPDTAEPVVNLNFCTRDALPPSPDDHLFIDATALLREDSASGEAWSRVLEGLRDVKEEVRRHIAKPRIRVRGSKHLTAAFLLGRMFPPPTAGELLIQQGEELWSSCATPQASAPLSVQFEDDDPGSDRLFVEIDVLGRSVRDGVRRLIQERSIMAMASLRLSAPASTLDASSANAMAQQIRQEIDKVCQTRQVGEIHLFCAAPQAFLMLMGRHSNTTVPVQLYEFDGEKYRPSIRVVSADFA